MDKVLGLGSGSEKSRWVTPKRLGMLTIRNFSKMWVGSKKRARNRGQDPDNVVIRLLD